MRRRKSEITSTRIGAVVVFVICGRGFDLDLSWPGWLARSAAKPVSGGRNFYIELTTSKLFCVDRCTSFVQEQQLLRKIKRRRRRRRLHRNCSS